MVNTFILCTSYANSMKLLDYRRLGKQRVEASQIINILARVYILAEFLKFDRPPSLDFSSNTKLIKSYKSRVKWYLNVVEKYRKYIKENGYIQINTNDTILNTKLSKYQLSFKEWFSKEEYFYSEIKLGWVAHSAVLPWIGYEYSLMRYTNASIKEWISRGYNNTMKIYRIKDKKDIPNALTKPWWILLTNAVIKSHKNNLYRKDPVFYENYEYDDVDDGEYVWVGKLSEEEMLSLIPS